MAAAQHPSPARQPALPALTGIRTFLALAIMLFHFTPAGLRWDAHPWLSLYPIVDIGYVFVSFFFLLSGFILTYNYAARTIHAPDFFVARFSRLYPVYLLTLVISLPMLLTEFHVRSHTEFYEGLILTPLMLQGFFPMLATFWNTVMWTLSCELMLYLAFPWLMQPTFLRFRWPLRVRWPRSTGKLLALFAAIWVIGLIPHTLYVLFDPDHLGHMADRYSSGFWTNTLKYTPLPYIGVFLCGITLGHLHHAAKLTTRSRTLIGILGFIAGWFTIYHLATKLPYIMMHGGLFVPIFAAIILGLAGPGPLARIFSVPPLLTIGASTYCLYLLHFNIFILLHLHHIPERLHLARFDPWVSYLFIVLVGIAATKCVEHPGQRAIALWWKQRRITS